MIGKLHILEVKPTVINWIIDFLKDRKQRVKLNGVYSDWLTVPAAVPQGTRLGPWLFLVLINDLRLPDGYDDFSPQKKKMPGRLLLFFLHRFLNKKNVINFVFYLHQIWKIASQKMWKYFLF